LLLAWVPALLVAQQNPVDRLREVLPSSIAEQVIATVTEATSRGLPAQAIANRALEAHAKGRNGAEVSAAAKAFAQSLADARGALERGGRKPDASEIESGANALGLGVDGAVISKLASSAPSGRSLAVPLAVIGALVNRGLPSDDALAAVSERLKARASNEELVEMPGEAGRLIAEGERPADVGRALGEAHRAAAGSQAAPPATPPSGVTVPAGPPASVPANAGQPTQRPQTPVRPEPVRRP
jgi:hypothetical protein